MKKSTKAFLVIVVLFFLLAPLCGHALSLTSNEIKQLNDVSRFIDQKPEGQVLRIFERAIKSDSVALKGLASIILVKHYGKRFQGLFLRHFTLNPANDSFLQDKKVLIKLQHINKLLAEFNDSLKQFKDNRVRQLFLFYHFRHKNVWMLGQAGEELSLAGFYRISVFESIFDAKIDVIRLATVADLKR